MSECVVRMELPHVCITENGFYGYCPMDRVWCIQRNAPPNITMREAYEAMTDKIPSWCPIICQLPEGHGRLVDADAMDKCVYNDIPISVFGSVKKMAAVRQIIEDAPTIVPAEAQRKVNASDAVSPTDTPTDIPTITAERSKT